MADKAANSIRLLLPLRQPRLAQAFDDARALGVEGRVVAIMSARIGLHCVARIDFLQLRQGLSGLFVVAGPGVGGGEMDPRVEVLRRARDRLFAPFDRLLPLRQIIVEVANVRLPKGDPRIART